MPRWIDIGSGWILSGGLHLALLLGAGLICMEEILESERGTESFALSSRPPLVPGENPGSPREPDRFLDRRTPTPDDPAALVWSSDHRGPEVRPIVQAGDRSQSVDFKSRLFPRPGRVDRMPFAGGPAGSKDPPRGAVALDPVMDALRWLARHQSPDGHWSACDYGQCCVRGACAGSGSPEHDPGITGLAVLAFLGAGFSPRSSYQTVDPAVPERTLFFGVTAKRGLQWLLAQQDPEGCIGPRGPKYLYDHAIATLALCEAYGLTDSPVLKAPAQRAIDFLVAAQNPGKAWRYAARSGDNDTSVTGWAVMALKSAELGNLEVPSAATAGALSWLDDVTDPLDSRRVGYNGIGGRDLWMPGNAEPFAEHPTMTAVGLLARIFLQKNRNPPPTPEARLVAADLPVWERGQIDFYYWYFGSLAMFQVDGPSGPLWKSWYPSMKEALLPHQKSARDGCQSGSWDPGDDRWGFEGGRVYATALNALSLEYYERRPSVFSPSR